MHLITAYRQHSDKVRPNAIDPIRNTIAITINLQSSPLTSNSVTGVDSYRLSIRVQVIRLCGYLLFAVSWCLTQYMHKHKHTYMYIKHTHTHHITLPSPHTCIYTLPPLPSPHSASAMCTHMSLYTPINGQVGIGITPPVQVSWWPSRVQVMFLH